MTSYVLRYPPSTIGLSEHYNPLPKGRLGEGPLPEFILRRVISPSFISVVVAVKDNQPGIDRFLSSLENNMSSDHYPREVVIVDNNSTTPIRVEASYPFPVKILKCSRPGPAAARNLGVMASVGAWVLFTDSDCVATSSFISGYLKFDNDCVGYAGMVHLQGDDPLTKYYSDQNAFLPFALLNGSDLEPYALVTANCLVLKSAFVAAGCFSEKFTFAGGEDTDLGIRMRRLGRLAYNYHSVAEHELDDGLKGFVNRYIRYGRGNRILEEHYIDECFEPRENTVNNPNPYNNILARLQLKAMLWGYEGKDSELFPYHEVNTPEVFSPDD